MLPCPQRPGAFPRDLGHLGAFCTRSGKACEIQTGSFTAVIFFFKLLHKTLLSNSFQWLRTPLNEPNTKLRERKV